MGALFTEKYLCRNPVRECRYSICVCVCVCVSRVQRHSVQRWRRRRRIQAWEASPCWRWVTQRTTSTSSSSFKASSNTKTKVRGKTKKEEGGSALRCRTEIYHPMQEQSWCPAETTLNYQFPHWNYRFNKTASSFGISVPIPVSTNFFSVLQSS